MFEYKIIDTHTGKIDMTLIAENDERARRKHNAIRWPGTDEPDRERYELIGGPCNA